MTKQKITMKSSILKKLLFWFLVVSFIPTIIIGYITYIYSERALKVQILESYTAIAEARIHTTSRYILEKEKYVTLQAHSQTTIDAPEKYIKAFNEYGIDSREYSALGIKFKSSFYIASS